MIKNGYRPQLRSVLKRSEALNEINTISAESPVVWIEGVAGSGKTTLVNSYLDEAHETCLWYSLDESDNDIAVFFNRISQYISKKMKVSDKTISLLSLPFRPEYKSVAKFFFQEIQAQICEPFALVLDDYHLITNPDFHEMLVEAFMPLDQGSMRVFIISRSSPAPVFSRLKAKRLMASVDQQYLQFNQDEIRSLVELLTGKIVDNYQLQLLMENTQGWVSGIVLLMDIIKEESIDQLAKKELRIDLLFDFFATELFTALDTDTQEFLLKSAILNEIHIEKDKYLSNKRDLDNILSTLYHKNYFTYRCKHNKNIYRYHPLFKAFLEEKATTFFSKKALFEIKKQIAENFLSEGNIVNSVPLFLETEEWDRATELVELHAEKLIAKGQATLILGWVNELPACNLEQHPWVLYWKANCILAYDQNQAYDTFIEVYYSFENRGDANGQYFSICGIIESVLFSFNNYHRINVWTKRVTALYSAGIKPKGLELSARLSADMHTALLFCEPYHPDLSKWEKNVGYLMKLLKFSFSADHIVLVGVNLFYQYLWEGDRSKAKKTLQITQPANYNANMNPVSQGAWFLMASVSAWLDGNAQEGLNYADKGLAVADKTGVTFWADILLLQKAYSYSRLGEYPLAREVLTEYQYQSNKHSQISDSIYYDVSSQLDYFTGDLENAYQNCLICVEKSESIGLLYSDVGFRISLGELHIARGELLEARDVLQRAKKECMSWNCDLYLHRCYLVETMLHLKENDSTNARVSMENAMKLAKQRGFTNHSWWHPDHITPLYEFALEHDIETDFVVSCIVHNKLDVNINLIEYDNWPWEVKIMTLGEFSILVNDAEISTLGKSMRRPISLLKALLSLGPWKVNQVQLADLLWPDAEADEAIQALNTTIYRLRKTLGSQSIWVKDGYVGLNKKKVWIDVERIKFFINTYKDIHTKNGNNSELAKLLNRIITCYSGRFLEKELDEPWIYHFAQTLENKVLNLLYNAAQCAVEENDKEYALNILNHARSLDILNETTYQKNIALLVDLGRHAEAQLLYRECKTLLSRVLGTQPSQEIYKLVS